MRSDIPRKGMLRVSRYIESVRLSLCAGLLLMVPGCSEWTVPACEGFPPKTPCVGPCSFVVEPGSTSATAPAVIIKDRKGTFYCQQIEP